MNNKFFKISKKRRKAVISHLESTIFEVNAKTEEHTKHFFWNFKKVVFVTKRQKVCGKGDFFSLKRRMVRQVSTSYDY